MNRPERNRFRPGDRVRWNYWTDRRESGWHYGTVVRGPFAIFDQVAYKIRKDGNPEKGIKEYTSTMAANQLEVVPNG